MDGRINLRLNLDQVKQPKPEKTCLEPVEPGRLDFPNDAKTYEFTASDLTEIECIGTGSYGGVVMKMVHKNSGSVMAVKRVRAHEIDTTKREQMLRELRIIIESQHCEDVVRFFGALFQDGDCWICMELLDCSLDKFYRRVFKQNERIPEKVIGFITTSVVRALNYLRVQLNIIHRDFGISGYLVDSIAKTQDVGCQIYMAPERLSDRVYGTRSDVWSLGISLVEICIGRFPYVGWNSVFDQLQAVVHGDPPSLSLIKETSSRPKYTELMEHNFFKKNNVLDADRMLEERSTFGSYVARFPCD